MRQANLYGNHYKTGDTELVTWHYFGQEADEEGAYIAAVIERKDGRVDIVSADRLQFIPDKF